jgi:phosphoserine phosphatase
MMTLFTTAGNLIITKKINLPIVDKGGKKKKLKKFLKKLQINDLELFL